MNLTEAELAERFYGAATPSPAPAAPVDVDPTAAVAARFFDHPTSHPNRAATPAQAAEHGFAPTAEDGRAFDQETLSAYAGVVRELGVDHDVAQQLYSRMAGALAERQQDALAELSTTWAEQARRDPLVAGADGRELQTNLRAANELLREFGDQELGTLLRETGLGSHPALVRFVTRLARDRR